MKRSEYKKKKNRKRNYSFLFLAFILLVGGSYLVYQYNSGKLLATENEVQEEKEVAAADDDENEVKQEDLTFEPFESAESQFGELNVLLLGNDARDDDDARSDTLMIGHYDKESNAMKIVSLMRDTYVEIPGHGQHKINAAFFFGGPELVRKTIKHNFDLDVQYYAVVDFKSFSTVVDIVAPDGIQVDIPYPMSHGIGMTLEPGEQALDGNQLLGYVRFRHDINSDFGRVERQQEVLTKIKEQAMSFHTLLNLPKLLGSVYPYIDTNITNRTLLTVGKDMLIGGKTKDVETLRIPIENSFIDKRIDGIGDVLYIDFEENKEALNQFLNNSESNSENELMKTEDDGL